MAGGEAKKIVAVDDCNVILKMLQNVLVQEGYEVRPFTSGTRALQFLKKKEEVPDLIILDIEMPEINGYKLLAQIKEVKHLKDVPVIFLTANKEKNQVIKAVADGAKDYVIKPIENDVLVIKLYMLLGNGSGESAETTEYDESEEAAETAESTETAETTESTGDTEGGEDCGLRG